MSAENLENIKNFEGWGLTLLAHEKKSVCEPESSLSSNFCSLPFHQIFLFFFFFFLFSFFSFFLSYCKTILETSSVSETSSHFLVRLHCSSINSRWRCFSTLHRATCDILISHLLALTIWEIKAVRKAKSLGFGFSFWAIEPIPKDRNNGKFRKPHSSGKLMSGMLFSWV